MKFGIVLASETDSWRWAQRAEELGFNSVWFYDSQLLYSDIFVSMALAAYHTDRIRLGTGVLVPSNRIEPVTANALATINKMAPGRVDFGIGTGFTARRTMGLDAIPLYKTRRYIERVTALLRGETIEWDFEDAERKIRFINPDIGIINIDDDIPVWFSATGPKSRQIAAEMGTHWLNFSAMEGAVDSLKKMQHCWKNEGRDLSQFRAQMFCLGAILTGDEATDNARLLAQGGPSTAVLFRSRADEMGRITDSGPKNRLDYATQQYLKVHEHYTPSDARYLSNHRGHMMFVRQDETHITPELVRETTFSGTEDELVENLRTLRDAGYDQINVQLIPGHEEAIDDWSRVFRKAELNAQ